ncbi:hypothetical protein CASFOL_006677 [Castilleja foliolosa]|uniref:Secreted protein n=1 Tax=Castilleja foliolosa TaxID=1961234 RepID=A0ABD3EAW8_9LAMI
MMKNMAMIFYLIVVQGILISALATCDDKLVSEWPAKAAMPPPGRLEAAAPQTTTSRRMLKKPPKGSSGPSHGGNKGPPKNAKSRQKLHG